MNRQYIGLYRVLGMLAFDNINGAQLSRPGIQVLEDIVVNGLQVRQVKRAQKRLGFEHVHP